MLSYDTPLDFGRLLIASLPKFQVRRATEKGSVGFTEYVPTHLCGAAGGVYATLVRRQLMPGTPGVSKNSSMTDLRAGEANHHQNQHEAAAGQTADVETAAEEGPGMSLVRVLSS